MARYIDANELCRRLNECWETNDTDKGRLIQLVIDRVITPIVVGTPTADVIEVVRCEKCKHGEVSIISRTTDGKERIACYCNLKNGVTDLNSYCPSGERRDT